MPIPSEVQQPSKPAFKRAEPRILTVQRATYLTPNMIRVIFAGPELEGFPEGCEGGNCKLMLPEPGEARDSFAARLANGPPPVRRTYTVRAHDKVAQEITIDFVAHGDEGPASRWASHAVQGDFLGFVGPSPPKVATFEADWYLVAADPSALPIAAVTLECMPRDAKGVAIFEVTSLADRQEIDAPEGIAMHWLVQPDPHRASAAQEAIIRGLDWPSGRVQTCIAGESNVIRSLRAFLHQEKKIPRADTYISGYWKIGLVEDEHQIQKREEV